MDKSIGALRQRLDAEADVLVAWLVANSTAWLSDDEQLPDELARPGQADVDVSAMAAVADTAETELHLLPGPDTASPSSRAVSWAWEAILRHGQPGTGHHIHIPLTQRQLAEAHHCSAGTIAWYLRCLGPAVRRSDGAVVFDRRVLAQMEAEAPAPEITSRCAAVAEQLLDAFGRPSTDGMRIELMVAGEGPPRPASLADMARHLGLTRSSTHRHLSALERVGRFGRCGRVHFAVADGPLPLTAPPGSDDGRPAVPVDHLVAGEIENRGLALLEQLTELMGDLTHLAEAVLAPSARPPTAQAARDVSAQSAPGDRLRAVPVASRGRGSSRGDLDEDEISSGQSGPPQHDPRKGDPVRADPPRTAPSWADDELPELLGPLLAACQARGLAGVTDAAGLADSLTPYSAAQIAAATQRVAADLAGGAPMRSPVAILVAKARAGDPYYFPPERRATPVPAPEVEEMVGATPTALLDYAAVDEEAARAVATLSAVELEQLDGAVRERFPNALPRAGEAPRRIHNPALWRRIVWRQSCGGGSR